MLFFSVFISAVIFFFTLRFLTFKLCLKYDHKPFSEKDANGRDAFVCLITSCSEKLIVTVLAFYNLWTVKAPDGSSFGFFSSDVVML